MRNPTTRRKFTEKDKWESLRESLNNNKHSSNSNWAEAVKLFRDRIYSKYFNPIKSLIEGNPEKKAEIRKGEGFSIVTVQCALIETFAAFREGAIYNYDKPDKGGIAYEYKAKDCGDLFECFLNNASIFKGIFYHFDKQKNKHCNAPFNGKLFYSQVRCGLMHEARTKGDWLINASKNDDPEDKKFIKRKPDGNKIYRTLLHYSLVEYFDQYLSNLKNPDDEFNDLRRKFARKLDHLYGFEKQVDKDNFYWGKE